MNKATVKNVLMVLVVFAIATMTACNLATPADTGSSVEVVLDGIGGAGGARGTIADADWVRINVKLTADGVQKGSGDLTYTANAWRGKISVSETGPMTFEATAGNQDGTTGVYHVSWSGSAEKNVTGSGLSLTIPVTAGDNTRHIFYINNNSATDGWRYLEAAPSDQSSSIAWSNIKIAAIGATAMGDHIGTGKANTAAIVGQFVDPVHCTSGAAYLCDNLSLGGYTDWFLPSKDELNEMYVKSGTIGVFAFDFYWSSSETDYNHASVQSFPDGYQGAGIKGNNRFMRAVRAF